MYPLLCTYFMWYKHSYAFLDENFRATLEYYVYFTHDPWWRWQHNAIKIVFQWKTAFEFRCACFCARHFCPSKDSLVLESRFAFLQREREPGYRKGGWEMRALTRWQKKLTRGIFFLIWQCASFSFCQAICAGKYRCIRTFELIFCLIYIVQATSSTKKWDTLRC